MTKRKNKPLKFYMALDLSLTQTALIFANKKGNRVMSSCIESDPKSTIEQRIYYIWQEILLQTEGLVGDHKVVGIAIEGLAVHGKSHKSLQLAGLHFYVRVELRRLFPNTKIAIIPPTSLKKWVTGGGKAQKDKMMLSCYKRWNYEAENSDTCDAFCLTRYYLANRKSIKPEWWI